MLQEKWKWSSEGIRAYRRKKILKSCILVDYIGLKIWQKICGRQRNEHTQRYKEQIEKHSKKREIEFVVVKGHTKNKYNKKVDELVNALSL